MSSNNSSSQVSQTTGLETVNSAGSTLLDATPISQNNILVISDSSLRGIKLMIPKSGQRLFLRNISANSCKIYPRDKHCIDGSASPIILAGGVGMILMGADVTNWITLNLIDNDTLAEKLSKLIIEVSKSKEEITKLKEEITKLKKN